MNYQICTRCVMDTSAKDISFDENGICNFCTDFFSSQISSRNSASARLSRQNEFIGMVKANGNGKEYDCIVGLSGGVDSSYALYLAVINGLRPLAVHLDNGWNSELAVFNIKNIVEKLNVDLYTHVIDWEENKDLQLSFFQANVVDIELLMDNAMQALNFRMANKYGLKYILAGTNTATEGFGFPRGWNHFKRDKKNILSIHKLFGKRPIKTHPLIGTFGYIYFRFIKGIIWESFLDYFPYNKKDAIATLVREFGYRPYPYKHYESVFTRFYQGYILPEKFGIDKRRMHLSNLICSAQMTRDEALAMLDQNPYPSSQELGIDKEFVLKKLGFSQESFDDYLKMPEVKHSFYGSELGRWDFFNKVLSNLRRYFKA